MFALLERLESDEEFRNRALSLPVERRKEFIFGAGYDIDKADLVHLPDLANVQELSEEDLERVAAGGTGTLVGEIVGVGMAATIGGIAAGSGVGWGVIAAACAAGL